MTKETEMVLRGDKCAEIIENISSMFEVSLEQAADIFYTSETAQLIEQGVADLHCRSALYLAQCVWDEYREAQP